MNTQNNKNVMENFFKEADPLKLFMIGLSVLAMISFMFTSNWHAAVWSFNTGIWCTLETIDDIKIKQLR